VVIERTIATTTHGRYLVEPPSAAGAAPMLVGFHGYGETADAQLDRLRAIPGAERWLIVSIQGLHRFYERRTNEVIASWMTRQDRELAIADNLAFVAGVIEEAARDWPVAAGLVFAGFSQGVAMTFRAATATARPVAGVIAAGGDVPPEIDPAALRRGSSARVCRGTRDHWYSSEQFGDDTRRIRSAGADVRPLEFDGGHEWSSDVVEAASAFLRARRA
jgi:predicted esterase